MRRVLNQAWRFFSVYGSLFVELLRFSPKWTISIVLCQFFGPVLQPAIIGVLKEGMDLIQGDPKSKRGMFSGFGDLEPSTLLLVLSVAVALLGLLAAILGWLGASGARKLGRLYRLNLAESIFERIATAKLGSIRLPQDLADESYLHKVTVSYGLKLNLAVICLFTAVRHGVSTLVLAASLIYLNARLALIFFGVAVCILPFYFLVNRKAHKASKKWNIEGGARAAALALMDIGERANALPMEKGADEEEPESPIDFAEEIHKNPEILENLETMEFGRLAGAKSQMYSQLFRAVFLGGGLYLFGLVAMNPGALTWDSLIVFLIAAAMLQTAISGLSSSISMLAWHSPPVSTINRYSSALFRKPSQWKSRKQKETTEGKKPRYVLVVSGVSLSRTSFHILMKPLLAHGVVEDGPESLKFQTLSMKRIGSHKWKAIAAEFERKDSGDVIFVDLGPARKLEKLSAIQEFDLSNLVIVTNSWDESLDRFDLIIKICDDGTGEAGPPSYWKDRDDLNSVSNQNGGLDLDFEEMF